MSNPTRTDAALIHADRLTGAALPARKGRKGAHRYFADAKSREIVDLWNRIGMELCTVAGGVGFTPEAKRLMRADVWSFANLGNVKGTKGKRHGDVEREATREAKRQARKAARSAMRRAGLCPISGTIVEQDASTTGRTTYAADAQILGQHIRRITALLPQITYTDAAQKNQWRAEFKALANLLNG